MKNQRVNDESEYSDETQKNGSATSFGQGGEEHASEQNGNDKPTIIQPEGYFPRKDRVFQPGVLQSETPVALIPAVETTRIVSDHWKQPAVIAVSNFKNKSLCDWSFNTAVGCGHGCRFCYVPGVSVNKQAKALLKLGVEDPDAGWGNYVFPREWDEKAFLASLRKAQNTPASDLKPDGNRAIMFSTTTDPYQVIKNADSKKGTELTAAHGKMVRRALELILENSSLNVRVLTRSPLAQTDFDLMKRFGNRLVFGMSLPTLNDKLARIYEPYAPAPSQRLKTLKKAKEARLNIFVAVAPTYPECDESDIRATLEAVKELDPITVFHEPINIRAENVERIRVHAAELGIKVQTEVFDSPEAWEKYTMEQLELVERLAKELGFHDRLHLWPDPDLGRPKSLARAANSVARRQWLDKWWNRVSEWPGKPVLAPKAVPTPAPAPQSDKPKLTVRKPGEILAMHFDDADNYLENGIFAKGQPLTILGPGGIGKSGLVLQLAVCTITGRDFIGLKVGRRKLSYLLVQAENGNRRFKDDLLKLRNWMSAGEWALVEENLKIHTLEKDHDHFLGINGREGQAMLAEMIKEAQADVVVFDPLYAFGTGNLNTDLAMQNTIRTISNLARLGKPETSVVILHHTLTGKEGAKKATGFDRGSYGRGSKALNSWTRGQLNVAPGNPEDNSKLVISCGKNSNGPEFKPFGIVRNPATMIFDVDPEFDLETWQAGFSGEPASPKAKATPDAIAAMVKDLPLKKKALVGLVKDGYGCSQASAYAFVAKAEGKTIRRNAKGEYEAMG